MGKLDGKWLGKRYSASNLVHECLDDKDPHVVALAVNGLNEKARTAGLIAQGRTNKLLAVLEEDLHLPPLGFVAVAELTAFIIGGVAAKVLDEEDRLEVLEQNLLGILAGGSLVGLHVEPVLVRKEILGVPLDHLPVCIPDNHLHRIHKLPLIFVSDFQR